MDSTYAHTQVYKQDNCKYNCVCVRKKIIIKHALFLLFELIMHFVFLFNLLNNSCCLAKQKRKKQQQQNKIKIMKKKIKKKRKQNIS